jgi:hypothetical protein
MCKIHLKNETIYIDNNTPISGFNAMSASTKDTRVNLSVIMGVDADMMMNVDINMNISISTRVIVCLLFIIVAIYVAILANIHSA